MSKKRHQGVPALRNDQVTGMTEEKQEEVIEKSGRARRDTAAKEFIEEQQSQAGETSASDRSRRKRD